MKKGKIKIWNKYVTNRMLKIPYMPNGWLKLAGYV